MLPIIPYIAAAGLYYLYLQYEKKADENKKEIKKLEDKIKKLKETKIDPEEPKKVD